jgi:hypothetical protein
MAASATAQDDKPPPAPRLTCGTLLAHVPSATCAPANLDFGADTQRMLRAQWATVGCRERGSLFHPESAETLLHHLLTCLQSADADGGDAASSASGGWDAARSSVTNTMAAIVKERPSLLLPAYATIRQALGDNGARVREAAVGLLTTLMECTEARLLQAGGGATTLANPGYAQTQVTLSQAEGEVRTHELVAGGMVTALLELVYDRSSLVASKATQALLSLLRDSAWLVHHPNTEFAVLARLVGLFAYRGTPAAPIAEKQYAAVTATLIARWFGETDGHMEHKAHRRCRGPRSK